MFPDCDKQHSSYKRNASFTALSSVRWVSLLQHNRSLVPRSMKSSCSQLSGELETSNRGCWNLKRNSKVAEELGSHAVSVDGNGQAIFRLGCLPHSGSRTETSCPFTPQIRTAWSAEFLQHLVLSESCGSNKQAFLKMIFFLHDFVLTRQL